MRRRGALSWVRSCAKDKVASQSGRGSIDGSGVASPPAVPVVEVLAEEEEDEEEERRRHTHIRIRSTGSPWSRSSAADMGGDDRRSLPSASIPSSLCFAVKL